MDDIDTKKLIKAFIGDMHPFKKNLIKVFIAIVLLMLIYKYIWCPESPYLKGFQVKLASRRGIIRNSLSSH